jgi:hypothetical protein
MFLLAGHNDLSTATGANSWVAAQPGAALNSDASHGWGVGGSCVGGRSHGAGGSHGIGGSRGRVII